MKSAVVFDCEFLTGEGSPSRFWCGPYDPDPVIAQIGLVRLDLTDGFAIRETLRSYVIPRNRQGDRSRLDPFFTRLTGITEENIEQEGISLEEALRETKKFAAGARLWSWGERRIQHGGNQLLRRGARASDPGVAIWKRLYSSAQGRNAI